MSVGAAELRGASSFAFAISLHASRRVRDGHRRAATGEWDACSGVSMSVDVTELREALHLLLL
jgi:hypothetical protein